MKHLWKCLASAVMGLKYLRTWSIPHSLFHRMGRKPDLPFLNNEYHKGFLAKISFPTVTLLQTCLGREQLLLEMESIKEANETATHDASDK